jgi:hypothetical protein
MSPTPIEDLAAWSWEPGLAFLLAPAGGFYGVGWRRLKGRGVVQPPRWRAWAFSGGLAALLLAAALSCARQPAEEADPIRLAWLTTAVRFDAAIAHGDKIVEEIANWDVAMASLRPYLDDRDAARHAFEEAARLDGSLSAEDKRLFLAEFDGAGGAGEQLATIVILNDPVGSPSAEMVRVETLPPGSTAEQTRSLTGRWRAKTDNARRILRGFLSKRRIEEADIERHRAARPGGSLPTASGGE